MRSIRSQTIPWGAQLVTNAAAPIRRDDELVLRVRDSVTQAALERFAWVARLEELWILEAGSGDGDGGRLAVPMTPPLTLIVAAYGHRPTTVSTADAISAADGRVLDIGLAPGWGAAVLVLDSELLMRGEGILGLGSNPALRGLPGAQVLADGRALATTDAYGLAIGASAGPIQDLEVLLPGWSVVAIRRFRGHARTPDGLGYVLMTRD